MKHIFGFVAILVLVMVVAEGIQFFSPKKNLFPHENTREASESYRVLTVSQHTPPTACDKTSKITGKKYDVIGDSITIRRGPSTSHSKLINWKSTRILKKTHFITIDSSTTIFEECTKTGWSWVKVTAPEWLKETHRGWVQSKFLDKGQNINGDKYSRKISSYALDPYTRKSYPKTVAKYNSRLPEIKVMRRKAAEMALDSGKCDYVLASELSSSKGNLNHLYFWVDCKNRERVYLDEFQIQKNARVFTQEERSWDKKGAIQACQKAIEERVLIPSWLDIHSVLGTTYHKSSITHNVLLKINFDARNSLGIDMLLRATCHFQPGEVGNIEISWRSADMVKSL